MISDRQRDYDPLNWADFVFASIMPLIGVLIAIREFTRERVGNGLALLLVSALSFAAWFALLSVA